MWAGHDDDPVRPLGEDPRLSRLARVVGQHLDAREVGDTLQRHLVDLADQRLMARHGLSWRVDPEPGSTPSRTGSSLPWPGRARPTRG